MITTRDKILSAVMKPTRYTGGELNSVIKNPAYSIIDSLSLDHKGKTYIFLFFFSGQLITPENLKCIIQ